MNKNIIATVLDYYQEKFDLKLKAIYDGICTASAFSKAKVTDRDVDFLIIETLLARVGKDVEEFEFLAGDDDYDLWLERLAIKTAMWDKDMEQVEERVNYYEQVMPKEQILHRQFCLYYKMKLAEWKHEEADVICAMAREALSLTKNGEDMPHKQQNLYTPMEMDFLLTLLHHRHGEWEAVYRVENCLRSIIEYVEVYYAVERLEDIEGRAWMELLQLAEEENNVNKLLHYIDNAIACCAKGTGLGRLAQLRFRKAKLLTRVGDGEEENESRWEQCMEECKMSYCIYQVLEQEEQVREIEKFCLEELQWHITI